MRQDNRRGKGGYIKERGVSKSNGMSPSLDNNNNNAESSNNPVKDYHSELSFEEEIQGNMIMNDVDEIINDDTDHHQYSDSYDHHDDVANANNNNADNDDARSDTDNDCTNNDESPRDDTTNHDYSSGNNIQPITLQGILARSHLKRRAPVGGKWNAEEDDRLREIVEEHGAKCWKNVSDEVMMVIVM